MGECPKQASRDWRPPDRVDAVWTKLSQAALGLGAGETRWASVETKNRLVDSQLVDAHFVSPASYFGSFASLVYWQLRCRRRKRTKEPAKVSLGGEIMKPAGCSHRGWLYGSAHASDEAVAAVRNRTACRQVPHARISGL